MMAVFNVTEALCNADNDEALLREVAKIFLEDSGEALQKLIKYHAENNSVKTCYYAHNLKGMAGNIGGNDLWALCEKAESFSRIKNLESINGLIEEIKTSHATLYQAVEEYLG